MNFLFDDITKKHKGGKASLKAQKLHELARISNPDNSTEQLKLKTLR